MRFVPLVESRDCAPEIVSAIADAMTREDEDSVGNGSRLNELRV